MTINFNGVRVVNASGGAGGGGVSWPGDGTKLLAGDGTQVIVGDNLMLSAGELSATNGSAGWTTALDLDFSALSNQTLSSDTTYTIGGKTWTKQLSSKDSTAMAIVNGSGLVIRPVQTSEFYPPDRSSPLLHLPLSQLSIPNLTWTTRLRVTTYISSHNVGANYDGVTVAIESLPNAGSTSPFQYMMRQGYVSTLGGSAFYYRDTALGSSQITTAASFGASNRTVIIELGSGMLGGLVMTGYTSTPGSNVTPLMYRTSTNSMPTVALSTMGITLTAHRGGSGTALAATFARLIVEYCY